MKLIVYFIFVNCAALSSGLTCWECHNARTNDECMETGHMVHCSQDDAICEDQIRHGDGGNMILIEKRCKQRLACHTNVNQNLRQAYPIQCNLKSPTSTCRCCCDYDMCNVDLLACWNNFPQYDSPVPAEDSICKSRPEVPGHANMQCYGNLEPGTYCYFECHRGYVMVGEQKLTCLGDFTWDFPSPSCKLVTCPPRPSAPGNGSVICTNGIRLNSHCRFSCDRDFALMGSEHTKCTDRNNGDAIGIWSNPIPYCKPLFCPSQTPLAHGSIRCSRQLKLGSVCQFECDRHYELYPSDVVHNQCTLSGQWSTPKPCCSLPCPPNVVMDFVVVMDSSSSVGSENWIKMKSFVRSFLDDFSVRENAAQYAIVRYNRLVDISTQILLNTFPNNIDRLLEAFDEIPYDGSGTHTGNALNHTAEVLLKVGNRLKARDVVLLITDGASQDDVSVPAKRVRDTGALLYVLPILPPKGRLDFGQIEQIVGEGNGENIIRDALEGGFEALDEEFARRMSELLCDEPCVDPFQDNPV